MRPYYDQDGITIYHGDCREVLPTLDVGSVDLVLTDPPYGTTACAWDSVIPLDAMWAELRRVTTLAAAIVLFGAQPFTSVLVMSNLREFRYQWVWEKSGGTGFLDANRRPLRCHEDVCVFARSQPTYNPQKVKGEPIHPSGSRKDRSRSVYRGHFESSPSDLSGWRFPRSVIRFDKHAERENLHPTQKPLGLVSYLLLTYSNPGDVVLDFAMGSGTTLRAAKDLGRRAIGIELEERYCAVAAKRLQQSVMALPTG